MEELIDFLKLQIRDYSEKLEEANTALKVLLNQSEIGKKEIEHKVFMNIKGSLMPVIDLMKKNQKNIGKHLPVLESSIDPRWTL